MQPAKNLPDVYIYTVSKKTAELFLSELRQISTNFDNFWHTDSTKDRFM